MNHNKHNNNHNINFKKTTSARRAVMQALYTWSVSKSDLLAIEQYYLQERNPKSFNLKHFLLLLRNIPKNIEQIDQAISNYGNRTIEQLDIIELCILRIATYEILFCPEIPLKVIISEALNLATMFGNNLSYKYINSVLDLLAKNSKPIDL